MQRRRGAVGRHRHLRVAAEGQRGNEKDQVADGLVGLGVLFWLLLKALKIITSLFLISKSNSIPSVLLEEVV